MNGPTGLIFAMRTRYEGQSGTEALFNEPDTAFSAQNNSANLDQGDYTGGTDGGVPVGFGTTGFALGGSAAGSNPADLNASGALGN
jgi:hypothetical protein